MLHGSQMATKSGGFWRAKKKKLEGGWVVSGPEIFMVAHSVGRLITGYWRNVGGMGGM